jgi:hypothetical protein
MTNHFKRFPMIFSDGGFDRFRFRLGVLCTGSQSALRTDSQARFRSMTTHSVSKKVGS